MRGRIDGVFEGVLRGWAWDPARPGHRLTPRLLVDGELLATLTADDGRVIVPSQQIAPAKPALAASVSRKESPRSKRRYQSALLLSTASRNMEKSWAKVPGPLPKIGSILSA